ncbi:MAG: methyltransferase domain-containing protein, partial [Ktedonobacteraceae bacterium]|nr:methyltransferase domain-containing protein [Ktedonobacteraceae bacterium]
AHLPEPHIVASYLRVLPPQQLHQDWRVFPRISSGSLFGNDAPLELEIGCGSAEQLCHLALQSPHTNFVGVDIARKSLEKGVEIAFSHRLRNIQFLYADFQQLYPLLVPRTLQTVYLHFPDPHLKPGHRKRRIFSPAFLDAIHSALIPGGRLSVMTDIESFLLDMLRLIETDSRFTRTHPERYLSGFTSGVRSHFQRVWEQHGETVYRFEYRTVMPPAGFSLTNLSRSK